MIADLLDLATNLAERGSGPGRPKNAELRRAVSSAYYALVQALARLCVVELGGWGKPWGLVTPICRAIDHRRTRDVLNDFRKNDPGSALASMALTFSQLQEARHEADSSPAPFRFKRSGTIDLVDTARQAVLLLDSVVPETKLMLAVRLVTRMR